MMNIILLIVGLTFLILSSELIVSSVSKISQYYKLDTYLMGVFLIAIGSDLPELIIAIEASWQAFHGENTSSIILGDIIGSSMGQGGLIIGGIALFQYLTMSKKLAIIHCSFMLVASLIFLFISIDQLVTRTDGLVLVTLYLFYWIVGTILNDKDEEKTTGKKKIIFSRHFILLIFAMIILHLSSVAVLTSINRISNQYNIGKLFISILGIGLSTSLPELAISTRAILKNEKALALGNLIGSNIFDILIIPGVSSILVPLSVPSKVYTIDIPFLVFLSFLLGIFLIRKRGIQKIEGLGLVIVFVIFVVTTIYCEFF